MHTPKAPVADPATAAAQAAEQRRAEAGQISMTQHGLSADTLTLRRRFGIMGGGVGTASTASAGGGGGSGSGPVASGVGFFGTQRSAFDPNNAGIFSPGFIG